jgi:ADP-ribosyl-[dinitrogen reductase] hydrolase
MTDRVRDTHRRARAIAALISFAIGDAHGVSADRGRPPFSDSRAEVSDATQTMLASCEGMLRFIVRSRVNGKMPNFPDQLWCALCRWGAGQAGLRLGAEAMAASALPAWLAEQPVMHRENRHGRALAKALANGRGTVKSAGCGVLCRIAPIGIAGFDPAPPAEDIREVAALSHDDPGATETAVALVRIVGLMMAGRPLPEAVETVTAELAVDSVPAVHREHLHLAALGKPASAGSPPAHLAAGALVEAVRATAGSGDVPGAVQAATAGRVHDASVIGALAGLLAGLEHTRERPPDPDVLRPGAIASGVEIVPADWLDRLDGREVVERMAADLVRIVPPGSSVDADISARFPGF